MQTGFGASPLEAGLRLLPWTAVVVVVAPVAGQLCDRVGPPAAPRARPGAAALLPPARPGGRTVRLATRRLEREHRAARGVPGGMPAHLHRALRLRPALAPAAAVAPGGAIALPPASPPDLAAGARRLLKHPRLMPYHRLLAAVLLLNLAVLILHLGRGDWRVGDGSALSALAGLTLVNLTAAVLIRQQSVRHALYGLAGRGPRSWPLWLRWSVSKVHHVGGIHAGAALAGTAWLGAFACVAIVAHARQPAGVSSTTLILACALVALAVLIVVC